MDKRTRTINGHTWEVQTWPGLYGLRIQARLKPVLAPIASVAGQASKSGGGGSSLETLLSLDVEKVASQLLEAIDEQETPRLIFDMMQGVSRDEYDLGTEANFNRAFSGNFLELYKGIAFVLEVNFGDLFSMVASTTEEPQASTEG